jgi:hypothetical protein
MRSGVRQHLRALTRGIRELLSHPPRQPLIMTTKKPKTAKAEIFKLGRIIAANTATALEAGQHAAPRQLATRITANLQHVEADAEELLFRLHALGEMEKADAVEALLGVVRSIITTAGDNLVMSCHNIASAYAATMKAPE